MSSSTAVWGAGGTNRNTFNCDCDEVRRVDRERADFIQKYFNVEWRDRAIYYSMMNTTIVDDAAVHMILEFKATYQARATA